MYRSQPYLRQAVFHPDKQPDWQAWPFTVPAVRDVGRIAFHPSVTFFVGENGSGKSTVLEALAQALGFSAEGGSKNVRFQTVENSTSPLHEYLRLIRTPPVPRNHYFLRAESFFNVASYMENIGYTGGYDGRRLHAISHGEAFMALLLNRLKGNGLYLFDEPEAVLSPARQLAALRAIDALAREQSQFIIATHSPILLAYPHARIIRFDADGVSEIAYEDCEHVRLMRDFLNHYPQRLARLLDEEDEES